MALNFASLFKFQLIFFMIHELFLFLGNFKQLLQHDIQLIDCYMLFVIIPKHFSTFKDV